MRIYASSEFAVYVLENWRTGDLYRASKKQVGNFYQITHILGFSTPLCTFVHGRASAQKQCGSKTPKNCTQFDENYSSKLRKQVIDNQTAF